MQLDIGQTDYTLEQWRGYDDPYGQQPRSVFPAISIIILAMAGIAGGLVYFTGHPMIAAIIFGGLALISIAIYPLLGLFLVVSSFALDGWLQLGTTFTAGKAFAGITGTAFLFRLWAQPVGYYFQSRAIRAQGLLVAVFLLHIAIRPNPVYWLAGLLEVSIMILMFALTFIIAGIPKNLNQLRKICMGSTIAGALLGLSIIVLGIEAFADRGQQRIYMGINENLMAYTLGIGLFASGIAWYGASQKTKVLIAFLDFLAMIAIALSGSRAVWLALAAAIVIAPLFATRVPLKYRIGFPLTTIIIVMLGHVAINQIAPEHTGDLMDRVISITEGESSGRMEVIWPAYWDTFLENPVTGIGPGTMSILGFEAHCDPLRVMSVSGLPGLIIYLWLVLSLFREAYRNTVPWLKLVSIGMIVFALVYGLTHTTLFQKPFAFVIGMVACMTNLGMCPKGGAVAYGAGDYPYESDIGNQPDSPGRAR